MATAPVIAPPAPEPQDTMTRYTDANGKWTDERQQLHRTILDNELSKASPLPAHRTPEAYMMGAQNILGQMR